MYIRTFCCAYFLHQQRFPCPYKIHSVWMESRVANLTWMTQNRIIKIGIFCQLPNSQVTHMERLKNTWVMTALTLVLYSSHQLKSPCVCRGVFLYYFCSMKKLIQSRQTSGSSSLEAWNIYLFLKVLIFWMAEGGQEKEPKRFLALQLAWEVQGDAASYCMAGGRRNNQLQWDYFWVALPSCPSKPCSWYS